MVRARPEGARGSSGSSLQQGGSMRHSRLALTLALLGAAPWLGSADDATADLGAARSLFERNIDAIRRRDRDAYLACYRRSDRLARGGPTGFVTGFEEF